jgi:hypothetical protein
MVTKLKPWHRRSRDGSIAFVLRPSSLLMRIWLYRKGWRHTHYPWWTKRSAKRLAVDDAHDKYFGYGRYAPRQIFDWIPRL